MRLKTPEQRERFRDFILPMPLPQSLKDKIRIDSEKAKQLAAQVFNTEGQPVK
jgi:hypothetical protein